MRVGIYGGTFAPVHNGHVAAARAFMEQMWLDILYVIPTGIHPHRAPAENITAADRLEMCRLAFADLEGVVVSDMEIRREGKSYTVDTLRALSREGDRLFLLLGTDMLLTLDTWREPEEIFRLAYPTYIRRESDSRLDETIIAKLADYHARFGKVVRRIVAPPIELSSGMVSAAVAAGSSIDGMVPPAVAAYIEEKQLFRA